MRDCHARELALPLAVRWFADVVIPTRCIEPRIWSHFLEDADYPACAESGLFIQRMLFEGFSASEWFRAPRTLQHIRAVREKTGATGHGLQQVGSEDSAGKWPQRPTQAKREDFQKCLPDRVRCQRCARGEKY